MLNVEKSTRRSHQDEIIEDSEPERELHRKRKAKTTARRITYNDLSTSEMGQQPLLNPLLNEVIEISDSDSEPCISSKDIPTNADAENNTILLAIPPSNILRPRQILSTNLSLSCIQKETEDCPESSNHPSVNHESRDAIKPIRVLDPKRFAYTSTISTKRKDLPNALQTASTKERRLTKPATFDLSNDDLSKVNHCVCCQASWTVRKSGPQKLMHIRSCAKKHALKEETVRVLLQTEVSKYVAPLHSKGKSKAKDSSVEAVSLTRKTFLEEVLGEESKKKIKSKQVETTLADVGAMRDSILARAQNILNSSCPNVPELDIGSPRVEQPYFSPLLSHQHHESLLPLTQPFLRSSLADIHGSSVSLFNSNVSPPRVNPMYTGTIQRAIHTTASGTYGASPPPVGSIQPSHSSSDVWTASSKTIRRRSRLSLEVKSDATSRKDHVADLVDSLEKVSLSSPSPSTSSSLDRAPSTLDIQATTKAPKKVRRVSKSRSPKSSAKKKKKAVDFGAKWKAHMIKYITQDIALYQRILRYEPIHFDIFLEIAALYTPVNSKTKQKTHMFLDEQAILTYGRAGWGSRGL
ncbi:hypothetical protein JR316_0004483 [Psilocybe cubensis]|uniref:Uncharacterized protein n=2 Tax=Psilocybe cubensis TaxID=181762 RepID=A0ACB8H3L0_PSICU|nr:hypothetical protein JR316_0004483 [Psilocybe cubensis]KAH9482383.1 hypothetical protein JR316_0004483 [Psilocybe cubensis]